MTRRLIPQQVRDAVFKRDGNKCVLCGIDEPLQLMHLIPLSDHVTANTDIDNLLTVCPNCHYRMDQGRIRSFEFESFVERLLRSAAGRYSDVARESLHQGTVVDVSAIDDDGQVIIECKAVFAMVGERFRDILARMSHLKTNNPAARVVLATLGELTSKQRDQLTDAKCEHGVRNILSITFQRRFNKIAMTFLLHGSADLLQLVGAMLVPYRSAAN